MDFETSTIIWWPELNTKLFWNSIEIWPSCWRIPIIFLDRNLELSFFTSAFGKWILKWNSISKYSVPAFFEGEKVGNRNSCLKPFHLNPMQSTFPQSLFLGNFFQETENLYQMRTENSAFNFSHASSNFSVMWAFVFESFGFFSLYFLF